MSHGGSGRAAAESRTAMCSPWDQLRFQMLIKIFILSRRLNQAEFLLFQSNDWRIEEVRLPIAASANHDRVGTDFFDTLFRFEPYGCLPFAINGIWSELAQTSEGSRGQRAPYTFVPESVHAWRGAETPAASAARAFPLLEKGSDQPVRILTVRGYQGQIGPCWW